MVGKTVKGIIVKSIDSLEKDVNPKKDTLAILTIPPADVQSIIDRLGKIGVKGILYFASKTVNAPPNVIIRNEDTTIELETITYHITNKTERPIKAL